MWPSAIRNLGESKSEQRQSQSRRLEQHEMERNDGRFWSTQQQGESDAARDQA